MGAPPGGMGGLFDDPEIQELLQVILSLATRIRSVEGLSADFWCFCLLLIYPPIAQVMSYSQEK